jgi:hypothetical protein
MEATFTIINRPGEIDRDLKLPPALRYFEAEPVRMQETLCESRDSEGRLHNERGYAVCLDDGTEEWWRHGHAHSVDDWPAIILGQSSEVYLSVPAGLNVPHPDEMLLKPDARVWCDDGLIHRDGNAAVELSPGLFNYQEYWCKGRRHRTDGPAVIKREETWYYHGLIHRHDGPAVVYPDMMKNHYGDWVWYGDLFSTREGLYTQDFPFHEPPAEFYMTAFLSMMSAPELPPHAVDLVVAKIEKLMPDFPVIWQFRELSGWQDIRGAVAICLDEREKGSPPKPRRKRKARVDSLPLPAGIGDDSYQYAGDVATDRKVA